MNMKNPDYSGFWGEVNAAKRQSDIAWGFQPQDLITGGLCPEGAQWKFSIWFTASLRGAYCDSHVLGWKPQAILPNLFEVKTKYFILFPDVPKIRYNQKFLINRYKPLPQAVVP